MRDYITVDEFIKIYLPSRVEMEAENNLAKWCKTWGVSYRYTWNILHGFSRSVSADFMRKIGCQYKVQTP
jgi:hypothetical protein